MDNNNTITTYKGTDGNMRCRGYKYELGETVTDDGAVRCGDKGFHSVLAPMDVFTYYPPIDNNKFFECTAGGTIDKDEHYDTKIASSELTLKAEIGILGIIKAQIGYVLKSAKRKIASNEKECAAAQGNCGHAAAQGNCGHAAAQGNYGHAAAQGNYGHAAAQGNYGHAAAQGSCGHAAAQGNFGHAAAQGNFGHAAAQGNFGHAAAQGNYGHAAAQGSYGHAAAQGNYGHAAAQGNYGHAAVHGKHAIAAAFGIDGKAKGELGDWLVLTEWKFTDNWHIKSVKTAFVDGEKIKADTWYILKEGIFEETDDE